MFRNEDRVHILMGVVRRYDRRIVVVRGMRRLGLVLDREDV